MQFEFDTQLDRQSYTEFFRLSLFRKKKRNPILRSYLWCTLFLILALFCLLQQNWTLVIFCLLMTVICVLLFSYLLFLAPKRGWKKMTAMQKSTMHYIFDEGQVQISANGAGFDEKTNIAYDHLKRVIETKFSYLLYISHNMAYIIPKGCLKSEEIPLLGALLREKVDVQKYQSII